MFRSHRWIGKVIASVAVLTLSGSCGNETGPGSAVTVSVRATESVVGGVTIRLTGAATVEPLDGRLFTRAREDGQWIVLIGDGVAPLRFRLMADRPAHPPELQLFAAVDTANRSLSIGAGGVTLEQSP
jgi:hypothetical protein